MAKLYSVLFKSNVGDKQEEFIVTEIADSLDEMHDIMRQIEPGKHWYAFLWQVIPLRDLRMKIDQFVADKKKDRLPLPPIPFSNEEISTQLHEAQSFLKNKLMEKIINTGNLKILTHNEASFSVPEIKYIKDRIKKIKKDSKKKDNK